MSADPTRAWQPAELLFDDVAAALAAAEDAVRQPGKKVRLLFLFCRNPGKN